MTVAVLNSGGMEVASCDLSLLSRKLRCRADLDLQLLRAPLPDLQSVLSFHVRDECVVHLVPTDGNRAPDDHASERDDGDLRRPAPDVEDHAGDRIGDRKLCADRRRERLFDQVYGPRARRARRLLDGVSLEGCQAARDTEHDLGTSEATIDCATHEVREHLLGDVEVGNDAVTKRILSRDARGGATDHALRLCSNREDASAAFVDRDHRWFEHHDPSSPREHDRVCSAEIDCEIARWAPRHRHQSARAEGQSVTPGREQD